MRSTLKHNQRDGPIANGLMHQLCCHSAIYPAAHSTYDTSLCPTYFSNTGNLFPNELLLEKVGRQRDCFDSLYDEVETSPSSSFGDIRKYSEQTSR